MKNAFPSLTASEHLGLSRKSKTFDFEKASGAKPSPEIASIVERSGTMEARTKQTKQNCGFNLVKN